MNVLSQIGLAGRDDGVSIPLDEIVVGKEDSRSSAEANRVHNVLKKYHVDPEKLEPEDRDKIDLFFIQAPTKLQGTKMLGVRGLRVEWAIGRFIELRLVNQDYPWYQRGKGSK